jgi:GT2 family glycosyltransferase
VDDGSNDENKLDDLQSKLNLKIIRIKPENKTWMNSSVPYNIGFKQATGEIVIIQNAECMHMGDIIDYAINNVIENRYISFACYSVDANKLSQIDNIDNGSNIINETLKIIEPINNRNPIDDCENGWYNHAKYNANGLHFCAAITKKNLNELGGFDEKYAHGIAYEDNDFMYRILKKGMEVKIIDLPFAIHQAHAKTDYTGKREFFLKNQKIYLETVNN